MPQFIGLLKTVTAFNALASDIDVVPLEAVKVEEFLSEEGNAKYCGDHFFTRAYVQEGLAAFKATATTK